MTIRSEDSTSAIPRTRADRPFYVDVTISGLLTGATDPEPSKSVKFFRHVQSYGVGGTGIGIDRTQATLLSQSSITTNGTQTLTYPVNSFPGPTARKSGVRSASRSSRWRTIRRRSPNSPPSSSRSGRSPTERFPELPRDQLIRFTLPTVTLALNDLYPTSTTYAQVYKGNPLLGTTGTIVPGSAVVINDSVPQNRVLTLTNYDSVFD